MSFGFVNQNSKMRMLGALWHDRAAKELGQWDGLLAMNPWQMIQYETPKYLGETVLWQNEDGTSPITTAGTKCGRADDLSGNNRHHVGQSDHAAHGDIRGEWTGDSVSLDGRAHFFLGDLSALNASGAEVFVLWHTPPYTLTGSSSERNSHWRVSSTTVNPHYPFSDDLIYENFGRDTRVDGIAQEVGIIDSKHIYHVAAHDDLYMMRQNGETIHEDTSGTGYTLDFHSEGQHVGRGEDINLYISSTLYGWVIFDRKLTEPERAEVYSILSEDL